MRELHIATVILVDDSFERPPNLAEVVAAICDRPRSAGVENALRESGIAYGGGSFDEGDPAGTPIWELELRRWWDENDTPAHGEFARIAEIGPDPDSEVAALSEMIGRSGGAFQGVSPEEWNANGGRLLEDGRKKGSVVCLFDLDLELANMGERGGALLLEEAMAHANPSTYFGILSNTYAIGAEEAEWRKLARRGSLEPSDYLSLSKGRIASSNDLAHGLKLLLLNHLVVELKSEATQVVTDAAGAAQTGLDDLSVWDFDHAVLRSSEDEGAWEVDTLLRLYAIRDRIERRRRAYERRDAFKEAVGRIRTLRRVDTAPVPGPSDRIIALRRAELYDGSDINRVHLPIDLGDTFETSSGKNFVLLEPECDLAIRPTGSRQLDRATLVPLKDSDQARLRSDIYPECPHYGRPGRYWSLHLPEALLVDLLVLDLAVMNDNGACEFVPGRPRPADLRGPLETRSQVVAAAWVDFGRGFGDYVVPIPTEDSREWISTRLRSAFTTSGAISPCRIEGRSVKFDLKRTGRILRPLSTELLVRLHAYRSRAAFDHDFASSRMNESDRETELTAAGS